MIYIETPISEKPEKVGWYFVLNPHNHFDSNVCKYANGEWKNKHSAFTYWLKPVTGYVVTEEEMKKEAVEFHEWVGKQGYRLSHYAANGEAVHIHESAGSTPFHELRNGDWRTTKELYQIFKSQQDSQPTDTGGPADLHSTDAVEGGEGTKVFHLTEEQLKELWDAAKKKEQSEIEDWDEAGEGDIHIPHFHEYIKRFKQ